MKNGIAMVTLVVTIAVMLTLVSVITYTGINTANTSKKWHLLQKLKWYRNVLIAIELIMKEIFQLQILLQ